jgi:DNA-binding HxlR family transcriptional regulator
MKWNDLNTEACPIARAMGVVGDRWTLLVLRNCFLGMRRFDQLQEDLGITRHVLAERLKKLEGLGLLRREPYQERPLRHEYRLTRAGKEFAPVMLSLSAWAEKNLPHDDPSPACFILRDQGSVIDPVLTDRDTHQELNHRTVRMIPTHKLRRG